MIYQAKPKSQNSEIDDAVTLSMKILASNGGLGASAKYVLYDISDDPDDPRGIDPIVAGGWDFKIPSRPNGTNVSLELDIFPELMGTDSADVFVTATQSGLPLKNIRRTDGKPDDWLVTVTKPEQLNPGFFSVLFFLNKKTSTP